MDISSIDVETVKTFTALIILLVAIAFLFESRWLGKGGGGREGRGE